MIRRTAEVGLQRSSAAAATAQAPAWILIPQIEHARVSGDLADAWHFEGLIAEPDGNVSDVAKPDDNESSTAKPGGDESSTAKRGGNASEAAHPGGSETEAANEGGHLSDDNRARFLAALRYAARHHDDGWLAWDERPGIDAAGRPTNFDEMRLSDSLSIWAKSIELSTNHSPLAGYFVAGHFCRLLSRFTSWQDNPATAASARDFLARQATHMAAVLSWWQPGGQQVRGRVWAELGVSYVQLFDAISLWLCCAERRQPWTASLPNGRSWTFSPVTGRIGESRPVASSPAACTQIVVDPWPFSEAAVQLSISGRPVPAAHYPDADELLAAGGEPIELAWRLCSQRQVSEWGL